MVDPERVADDLADALARVERRVRVLEDHLHLAPERPQLAPRERRDVGAVEADRAARRLVQPHEQPAERRLPAARLADDAERLAAPDLERDAVDRVDELAVPRRTEVERTGKCLTRSTASRSTGAAPFPVMRSPAPARRRATPPAAPAAPQGRDGRRPRWPGADALEQLRPGRAAARSGAGSAARTGSPRRGARSDGGAPGIAASRRTRGRSTRGIEPSSPQVYGCCGSRKIADFGPSSTTRPAYITTMRSASSATTPMSWVMSRIEEPYSRCRRFISSRICAWIVTSSAVVGSSAISSDGLHESAIAIITRWRIPPENWCG